jgi:collagenase-like PrtC family protease
MNDAARKIELTAPAGGWQQLVAAVNAGADSIYLGYRKFGARAYAENFDMNQLKRAVDFSHSKNVKVYLTLNTLVKDREIREVAEFLDRYICICSDGIIVQDYGIFKLIKDLFRETPVHASTQMNIHSVYSLKMLEGLGFKRAILAREMTLDEIKDSCAAGLLEIEVFGHGSQCYSYSGNCYFSSFVGGRSGNRGRCSQPCRMKYKLASRENEKIKYIISDGSYLFSKEDICALDLLPSLIKAGVDAVKIEGRMKSPEYVGIVTGIYRKYINLYYRSPKDYKVDKDDLYKIRQIFSRDLGPGYLMEKYPENIISVKKSGSIGNFLGRVYRIEEDNDISVFIRSSWRINRGDIIEMWTSKGKSRIKIRNISLIGREKDKYKYRLKLNKKYVISRKDRVFKYFDRELDEEAKQIYGNEITKYRSKKEKKNKCKEYSLQDKKIDSYMERFETGYDLKDKAAGKGKLSLSASIYDCRLIEPAATAGADNIIYCDFNKIINSENRGDEELNVLKSHTKIKNLELLINLPPVIYDESFTLMEKIILGLMDSGLNNFKTANPGSIKFLSDLSIKAKSGIGLYLGSNLNIFNTLAVLLLKDSIPEGIKLKGVDLSCELNIDEIKKIISNYRNVSLDNLEFSIFGHGYLPVMNSRYSLKFLTGKAITECFVEDMKGYRFPLDSDYNGNVMVFNSRNICSLFDIDKVYETGVNNILIDGRFFKEKEFLKIIRIYREAVDMVNEGETQRFSDFMGFLKDDRHFKNYTRGHLMRGVE